MNTETYIPSNDERTVNLTHELEKINKRDVFKRMLKDVPPAYESGARKFVAFLKDNGHGLSYEGLLVYLESLREVKDGKRYASQTVNYYTSAALNRIRAVLDDAEPYMTTAERYRIEKALSEVKREKINDRSVDASKILTYDEIDKLIRYCADERLAVWIGFLAATAVRISEMLGVLLSDIKPLNSHYKIRIHGKGAKERFIDVDKGLVDNARKVFQGRKYLFEKRNGNKPYSRTYVSTNIRRLADSILHKVVSAHTLRHSWATAALKSTGRIKAVQRQLGHSSSSTTIDLYVHDNFSFEELQAIRSGGQTQDVVSDSNETWRPKKTEEQYDYGELFALA